MTSSNFSWPTHLRGKMFSCVIIALTVILSAENSYFEARGFPSEMVINTKENFFSKRLKMHKIFYGKSWKHWGNSFILHATDVNWRVTVFSIAQVFQQCNFTIASNYNTVLKKSVRQEKSAVQLLSLILMAVSKNTFHKSHYLLSFPSTELYIKVSFLSLAEIGDLQLFTENAMTLHSTIQRWMQVVMNYRVGFRSTIKRLAVWSDPAIQI